MNEEEKLRRLAERIYELDEQVYKQLGSSLGRVFGGNRERCVDDMVALMRAREESHTLRSELALISNMARTIQDRDARRRLMTEYDQILREVIALPTSFAEGDVINQETARLNSVLNLKNRFSEEDHLVICISRAYRCGGNEIGFALADALQINYYDVEIFDEVLRRLDAEKDSVWDHYGYATPIVPSSVPGERDELKHTWQSFQKARKRTFGDIIREFNRYLGLTNRDAVFFNQSDLICEMAKKEDFVVMGRYADMILTNNGIPHVSICITAPMQQRVNRVMSVDKNLTERQARRLLKHLDREHDKRYRYYTGKRWGSAVNYDLCINSGSYGIEGSVELIKRMIQR